MQAALKAIRSGQRFIVCSHVGPDGDAMASMLAMGLGLEQLGKKVIYYNEDGVPGPLDFLPAANRVISDLSEVSNMDVAISMDCGDLNRLGDHFIQFKGYKTLLNVDHHASNDRYGDINFVLPDAASSGEVVWKLLENAGCRLTQEIATNIYCTLVTDTGSFRYSNTSAHTLQLAAQMVGAGAEPAFVSQNLFERQPLVTFQLLKRLLDRLTVSASGNYAWSVIFQKDLRETGASYEVTEEFINYPRSIRGIEVALLFKEQEDGSFKVSLRSKLRVDVSQICQSLGGGGHVRASACTLKGDFESVKKTLFSKVEKALQ